ncbi:hypothetical protein B5M09_012929 [Aphanomyces astaci]|uniref:Membrane-associated protein n=1 Tax=Aphanomyces astaci TaxID=112090 RepID=A0A3R7WKK3_APHAT|nr:hypothetical protein B5M09_012929 [Aphanomyces astaci]
MEYHRRHGGGYTNYAVALAFTLLSTATVHAQPTADPAAATSTSVPDAVTSTSAPAATTSTAGSAAATSTSVPQVVARGLNSGATAALIIGLVLAGCTIYGVVMYLKHQRLQDAALATRKLDSHDDSPPYIEAGRHGSDDFDAYFGKQPPLNGAAASHCVKFASARGAMLAPPHVAVDINLLRAKSTPAMLSSSMSKQDALPRVSMAAVDETPNDTVTAMRSYRSMIQQTMGDSVDVAWMSPVESSRSMFPSRQPARDEDDDEFEWMSALESSRTNNLHAMDTMRSALDYDLAEEGSDCGSSTTTFNL